MATIPSAPTDPLDFALYTPFLQYLGIQPDTITAAGYDTLPPGNVLLNNPDTFLSLLTADSRFLEVLAINDNADYKTVKDFATIANSNLASIARLLPKGSAAQGGATSTGLNNNIWTALLSATNVRFRTSSGSKMTSESILNTFLSVASTAYINYLTATNLSSQDGFINNLSSFSISATDGVFVNLNALSANIGSLTCTNLFADNTYINSLTADHALILHGLTAEDVYVDRIHVKFPDPPNSEYLELINIHHTDVPALRVTQYGDTPVAIFYDKSGHPENNIKDISIGGVIDGGIRELFAVGLNNDNKFLRWGDSNKGQLISLTPATNLINNSYIDYLQVAAGGLHTVILSAGDVPAKNTLLVVGSNTKFQLTTTIGSSDVIALPQTIDTDFKYIAAGQYHSAAIKNNGDLYTWGSNIGGQLGNGNTSIVDDVVSNVITKIGSDFAQVKCGDKHTIALKQDGTLWAWGNNAFGQLGVGTIFNSNVPQQVGTDTYTSISCGLNHSAAISTSGDLYVWGKNSSGQVGNNDPSADLTSPTKINADTFKFISCGHNHTAAISNAGELYVWGENSSGQVGDNTKINVAAPVSIDPATIYKFVAAGPDSTIAITDNESVYAWGSNDKHQFGAGTISESLVPFLIYTGQANVTNVALFINGTEDRPGFVGIKTDLPNKELTVKGDISASGTIYGDISSAHAYIENLTAKNSFFTNTIVDNISATNLTAINAYLVNTTAVYLSTFNLTADNAFIIDLTADRGIFIDLSATNLSADNSFFTNTIVNNISTTNLTAINSYLVNVTAVHLSAFDITANNGYFKSLTSVSLSTTNLTSDFAVINFDISAKKGFFDELYVAGKQGTGGGGGVSSVVDGLTAEYLEIINHHEDIPALRVTQFGEQPLAIFYDVSGRPERNIEYISSGGLDIPGTAGEAFTIALDRSNTMFRWGSNVHGQLATNTDPVMFPQRTNLKFTQIDTAGSHSVGLSANNVVLAWGYNVDGQLGNGDLTFASSTTPVSAIDQCAYISAGGNFSAAIKTNGDLYVWGSNSGGQLGINANPATTTKSATPVKAGQDFSKVSCGGQHAVAIKADGSLWGWGANSFGQVGDSTNTNKLIPTLIDNTKVYKFISSGTNHSLAIDTDDNLYTWGSNDQSQLGTAALTNFNTPQLIGKFSKAACGFFHTVAINLSDELYGWGKNTNNQLVAGAATTIDIPQEIGNSRLFKFCTAGKDCTFGIDFNSSVFVLGNNDNFQIGLGIPLADVPTLLRQGEVSAINVAMIIDGSNEAPGFVGIKTSTPNKELTVKGDISASGIIYGEISATTINVDDLFSTESTLLSSHQLTSYIDNLFATYLSSNTAYFDNVNANNIFTSRLTSASAFFNYLSASKADILNLYVGSLSVDNLTAKNGKFDDLTVTHDLSVKGLIFGTLSGNAIMQSLCAKRILATEMLGVNVTSFDILTASNTNLYVSGNTLITGNLSALGDEVLLDAKVRITDSLRISNPRTDTCLIVNQGGGLPIAEFIYTHEPWEADKIALYISGYGYSGDIPNRYSGGYVGVRTRDPNEALTVRGNVSASGNIYTDTGTIRTNILTSIKLSADQGYIRDLTTAAMHVSGLTATSIDADIITTVNGLVTDSLSVINNVSAREFIGSFTGTINVENASFKRLSSIKSFFENTSAENTFINNLTANNAIINHLSAFELTAANLSAFSMSALDVFADNLKSLDLSGRNFEALSSNISSLTSSYISSKEIYVGSLTALNLSAITINIDNINVKSLISNKISSANILTERLTASQYLCAYNLQSHSFISDAISGTSLLINQVLSPIDFKQKVTISNHLDVTGDIRVVQDVYANRFHGDIIGATVSIGSSADLISLSAQNGHINNLLAEKISSTAGFFEHLTAIDTYLESTSALSLTADELFATRADIVMLSGGLIVTDMLSSFSLTSDSSFLTSLTSNTAQVINLSARSFKVDSINSTLLNLANTGLGVALTVTQYGPIDVAGFYYNEDCLTNVNIQPALVIKGNGCASGAPLYNGGYVGIRTSDPAEALTVVGNVSANNLYAGLSAGIGTNSPNEALTVIGSITATNNIYATNDIRGTTVDVHNVKTIDLQGNSFDVVDGHIINDLTVDGNIFGNIVGTFTSSGQSNFDVLTARRITAEYIEVDNLSATNTIYTPGGDSNKWNSAYNIPVVINMVFAGGGQPINPETRSFIEVPFDVQILSWALYADVPSSYYTAVSVLSSDFASYPTAVPIYTSAPTLAPSQIKSTDSTSTWNNVIQAHSILYFGICAQKLPDNSTELDSTLMTLSLRGLRN